MGLEKVLLGAMTATIRMDKAGRLVLPKDIREHLQLAPGSTLKAEIVGDHVELSQEVSEVKIVREKGLRVIVGWEGFDAAEAVREARERQLDRLEAPFQK
jgi:AbrB family looped-hinge helix DNA binding protein